MMLEYLIIAAVIIAGILFVLLTACAIGYVYGWISELYAQRKFEQRQEDYKKRI